MRRILLLPGLLLAAVPSPGADGVAEETGYMLPPAASLSAIVERPLFSPSRRGKDATATASSAAQGPARLLGVVAGRQDGRALLLLGGVTLSWLPGQERAGWRLLGVEPGAVRLAGPDGTVQRLAVGAVLPASN